MTSSAPLSNRSISRASLLRVDFIGFLVSGTMESFGRKDVFIHALGIGRCPVIECFMTRSRSACTATGANRFRQCRPTWSLHEACPVPPTSLCKPLAASCAASHLRSAPRNLSGPFFCSQERSLASSSKQLSSFASCASSAALARERALRDSRNLRSPLNLANLSDFE